MARTVLVTGAAGFAGSHLLDLLGTTEDTIVGWRRAEGATVGPAHVRWQQVDVLDRAAVRSAIAEARPAVVYHCAGAAHVGRAWDRTESTFATNVRATHHLLDALSRERIAARVLIPSSALVYAGADTPLKEEDPLLPSSPYGLSKLAQEMLARHIGEGVSVTIARAFNHVGPRQSALFAAAGFARRIADIEKGRWEPVISVGNLEARREATDVRDTVRAYQAIAESGLPGRPYNVCSGQAISIRDLLDRLIARARADVAVAPDPRRYRPNDVPLLAGDPSRIRGELGWTPQIPLEQTLDDLLDYWRRQP